ncbi:MAG: hypothetical protein PHV17_08040 [Candidatus Omnitrophica bacterium]|nr:hypothetical protein [Candidatus Omnitrophota bacterium]
MRKVWFFIIFFGFFSLSVFASQEGALKLSSFVLESKGIGESGPVLVNGIVAESNNVTSLSIKAFGKDYEVVNDELAKIPKAFYNGIQLSYEKGYQSLNGRQIYIILQSGFISGVNKRVLISVSENGDISVRELK